VDIFDTETNQELAVELYKLHALLLDLKVLKEQLEFAEHAITQANKSKEVKEMSGAKL
jgi:hypothetical protein